MPGQVNVWGQTDKVHEQCWDSFQILTNMVSISFYLLGHIAFGDFLRPSFTFLFFTLVFGFCDAVISSRWSGLCSVASTNDV